MQSHHLDEECQGIWPCAHGTVEADDLQFPSSSLTEIALLGNEIGKVRSFLEFLQFSAKQI